MHVNDASLPHFASAPALRRVLSRLRAGGPSADRLLRLRESCSAMLNGDYDIVILVADITDATGWCIDFGTDNVTFDGNGRVILGNGTFVGIDFSNRHNVVVRNSVVLLFEYGIYGDFCHDVVVQENSVLLCALAPVSI